MVIGCLLGCLAVMLLGQENLENQPNATFIGDDDGLLPVRGAGLGE